MIQLASSFQPEDLPARAYGRYEKFRPAIPAGVTRWGAAGELDLDRIVELGPGRGRAGEGSPRAPANNSAPPPTCRLHHHHRPAARHPQKAETTGSRGPRRRPPSSP